MSDPRRTPSPLMTMALSLLAPGIGQMAGGSLRRGLILFPIPFTVAPLAALSARAWGPSAALWGFVVPVLLLLAFHVWAAADAHRVARRAALVGRPAVTRRGAWLVALLLLVGLCGSSAAILWLRENVYQVYLIPTGSMAPTIAGGDRVVVNKVELRRRAPQRGELVIFRRPAGPPFVKRVIGLPGDEVAVRQGRVVVNGHPATESTGDPAGRREEFDGQSYRVRVDPGEDLPARRLDPGHYFLLGDDRTNSRDSRHFGDVPAADLIGPVVYRIWPLQRAGVIGR